MALLLTPYDPKHAKGVVSGLATVSCDRCSAQLVVGAHSKRILKLIPRLERAHRCSGL